MKHRISNSVDGIRGLAIGVATVVVVASMWATPAWAASPKFYSASIVSPPTSFGGDTEHFTVTISNLPKSQQSLGSANVTVPSGFTSLAVVAVTPPAGKTWTGTVGPGNVIQLRNPGPSTTQALAPGQSVSVEFSALTPCPRGTYALKTETKQSNDFGGVGNNFKLVGLDPSITISIGCPDHLAFDQQPSPTTAGQPVTPGVTVRVEDDIDQLITISTVAVTVSIGTNPGPGTLYGTTTTNAVGGIATFSDLAIDTAGSGYTLVASSQSVPHDGVSQPFDITGVASKCNVQGTCQGGTGNGATRADTTVGSAAVPVTTCTLDVCFLSVDEFSATFCDGECVGNAVLVIPPPNASGDAATGTVQYDKSIAPNGTVTTFLQKPDGTVIQLVDCSNPTPDPSEIPCVLDTSHPHGNLQVTVIFYPDDPAIGNH